MKEDRFSPPSYLYEPTRRPANDVAAVVTAAVMWGAVVLIGAVEIYLAVVFVGPLP